MASPIPVQNLYYMFCYAWDRFPEGRATAVGATESPDLPNLLARVLINATRRLRRIGFDRGYIRHEEDTACLRGRVLFGETIKQNFLPQAKAYCALDELSRDILQNQILKTTLDRLSRLEETDKALKDVLRSLCRELPDIRTIELSKRAFRMVQLHRNNAFYSFVLNVCELIHDSLLPAEGAGQYRFADILRDEARMGNVFERFVRNFYRLEQNSFKVSADQIRWNAVAEVPEELELLPFMFTDISLRAPDRTIIIDTKYYRRTMQERHGRERLRSENLYQVHAYLKNLEARDGPDANAEGMLLYPTVRQSVDVSYVLQGHPFRVYTLDLSQDWRGIHADLLGLIG